jgi:3'-phosphoadenosine 5'-phosphosulfate sulfotransferase (PAPS reductase)/FAD synthetase
MADIVKVSWSGGKDSTCAVMLHIERGDKVKAVCYIPMFTPEIPLISKDHYQFILDTAERFREMGAEVHIMSGMTYWDFVTHRKTKGKNKGMIMGFPLFKKRMCKFRNYSKERALDKCDVGYYDYQDIGIALDELARHGQLNDIKRSILVEMDYTEDMAFEFCRDRGLLSPHYKNAKRDGCALCPHARKREREIWLSDYPSARELLVDLQNIVKQECPHNHSPLRNGEWFIDTDQISFFD